MLPETIVELSDDELRKLVLEAIGKSAQALNASDVLKSLPKMYRVPKARMQQILEGLHSERMIAAWGKTGRYAAHPAEMRAREALVAALREPVSSAKLRERAGRSLKGYPSKDQAKLLNATLRALVDEKLAIKYPRSGERYGASNPKRTLTEALRDISKSYPHASPAEWHAALEQIVESQPAPKRDLHEIIQAALLQVEPRAANGAVGWLPDVRARISPPVPKREFDEAVLALARRNILSLHEFSGFLQVPEEERDKLVFDGKDHYYGGVAFVRSESI